MNRDARAFCIVEWRSVGPRQGADCSMSSVHAPGLEQHVANMAVDRTSLLIVDGELAADPPLPHSAVESEEAATLNSRAVSHRHGISRLQNRGARAVSN